MKEEKVIEKLSQGDIRAFRIIYERYWPQVLTVCERYTGIHQDALELTQDIFYDLWTRHTKLDLNVNISAYLHTAAKHQSFNYLRNKQRTLHKQAKYQPALIDNNSSAEDVQYKEFLQACQTSIQQIKEPARTIFQMSRDEQRTHREIAEAMDISVKMVEYHIGKTLKILRKSLREFL